MQLLLFGVARQLDHLQARAHLLGDRLRIGRRHDPEDRRQIEPQLEVPVLERRADNRFEDIEQRAGDLGFHLVEQFEDEGRVSHPGLAQAPDDASRGDAFLPADHLLGVVLVERHAHVSAPERLGDGHGQ